MAAATAPPPRFEDSVQPEVFDIRLFTRLAIDARGVSSEEVTQALRGRLVYIDLPANIQDFGSQQPFAATRTDIDLVIRAVRNYSAAFGPGDTAKTNEMAAAIAATANRYFSLNAAGQFDAQNFRTFLESDPAERQTLEHVQRLQAVLSDVQRFGLTPAELAQTRKKLVAGVAPKDRLTPDQFLAIVEARPAQPRPTANQKGS